jgi:hypothetical protein
VVMCRKNVVIIMISAVLPSERDERLAPVNHPFSIRTSVISVGIWPNSYAHNDISLAIMF